MVVDYSKAKVYKIYNTIDSDIYIGSTCCSLGDRMAKHRCGAKHPTKSHYRLYQKMNELGVENFFIVLIDEMPQCQNKEQLHKKEREKIEEVKPALNYAIPSRTNEEYQKDNEEQLKEYRKDYYIKNQEEKKQKAREHREKNLERKREMDKLMTTDARQALERPK